MAAMAGMHGQSKTCRLAETAELCAQCAKSGESTEADCDEPEWKGKVGSRIREGRPPELCELRVSKVAGAIADQADAAKDNDPTVQHIREMTC